MADDLFTELDIKSILGSTDYLARDLKNFNPGIAITSPLIVTSTVATYAVNRRRGLATLESKLRERARGAKGGKFNKTDVWYTPIAPPPAAWDYRCRNCRFYHDDGGEDGGHCELVGHDGDPFGGESINPDAWCAIWMPEDETPFLSYLSERLEGEGE